MDLLPHFLATLALVVVPIFLFYTLKNTQPKTSPKHTNTTQPPEPAGALPFIGHLHLLRGALPLARTLGSMADEAGPVYSLRLAHRRRAVVLTTWEATKDCFTTNDRALATRPKTAFGRLIGYGYASFAIAPYGPYWRDIRKMVSHELFTPHQIPKLNSVLFTELNHFIKDLFSLSVKYCGSDPVKLLGLDGWVEDLTFNTTTRLVVGKRCSGGRSGAEGRRLKEAVKRALYLSGVFVVSDMVPWAEWFDFGGYVREMKETAEVIDGVLREWLEEHKGKRNSDGGEDKDFMDVMLSSVAEGTTMSGYNRDTVIKATILVI